MGTSGHATTRDELALERALADQHALAELMAGADEQLTVTETADLPFPAETVWAVLSDPETRAHLGTSPVVAATDVPGTPTGAVGSRRCTVHRLPDGRLEAILTEVVDTGPGMRMTDRALTSPFPLATTFAVEPLAGPEGCRARLSATGTTPGPIAQRMADEWAAGLRYVMWRVRDLLGDPEVVGTAPPQRTDDERAWLERLGSVDRARAQMSAVPVTERATAHVAAPVDVVWHLLSDVDSPLADPVDPTALRFVVPRAADADADPDDPADPDDADGAGPLLATVTRCPRHQDHLHVDLDEVLESVPMHRMVIRSLRDVRPARTVLRLMGDGARCRVEAESTFEVPAVLRRESRRRARAALEGFLEALQQHATGTR